MLFSGLDLLLQRPLPELLKPLPLSEEIKAALLEKRGILGKVLSSVQAYEIADWDRVPLSSVSQDDIVIANMESVMWADMIIDTL